MSTQVFMKTFLQGYEITIPHGCNAGGMPNNGDCFTNGHIFHSISALAPVTSHWSSRHRSLTGEHSRHQAPVTSQ